MVDLTEKKFWNKRWKEDTKTRDFLVSSKEMDRLISKVITCVKNEGSVLELGIAPGHMIKRYFLRRRELRYDGIDISSVGLEKTRCLYDDLNIKGSLYLKDFREVGDLESGYDLVCSHGFLEHFDDMGGVIRAHLHYVKPEGVVFITIPNYSNSFVSLCLNTFSKETVKSHNMDCMSILKLSNAVKEAGGEIIEVGSFGGAILPHSGVNNGLSGWSYKKLCQFWNTTISLINLISFGLIVPRMWDIQIYVILKKKTNI